MAPVANESPCNNVSRMSCTSESTSSATKGTLGTLLPSAIVTTTSPATATAIATSPATATATATTTAKANTLLSSAGFYPSYVALGLLGSNPHS
jgi:hypothetical protein